MIARAFLIFMVMGAVGVSTTIGAQEHPSEHPTSNKETLTKEALADSITKLVNEQSMLQGGYFLFYDSQENKPLVLTLDKVHRDRLATLGDGVYFACADFNAQGGDTYDLDIFMKEGKDGLTASEINIHKKNGKARYTWVEKNSRWEKKLQ